MRTNSIIINYIDNIAFTFFLIMAFFIPSSNAAVEICFGIILACFILRVIFERPRWDKAKDFFKKRLNFVLLLFFLTMGFSLLASGDLIGKSFRAWTCKWGEGVLLFYFAQFFLSKRQIKMILMVFAVTAFITTLSGLYQYSSGFDFLKGYQAIKTERFTAITASFNHWNDFATFLVAMFFIVYGFLKYSQKVAVKILLFVFLLMMALSLIFTYSRGGWLAFVLILPVSMIFFSDKKGKLIVPFFLLVLAIGVMLVPAVQCRFLMAFQVNNDADRFLLWKGAFSMLKASPVFGTGVGLFMDRLPEYSDLYGKYAHNKYIQILAETGILGFLTFLWFLWELIFVAYRKLRKEKDPLIIGLFLGITAFLIHSFFDTQFYSLRLAMFFWMLAGMLGVYVIGENKKKVCVTASQV